MTGVEILSIGEIGVGGALIGVWLFQVGVLPAYLLVLWKP